jgi:hypothetical protein
VTFAVWGRFGKRTLTFKKCLRLGKVWKKNFNFERICSIWGRFESGTLTLKKFALSGEGLI